MKWSHHAVAAFAFVALPLSVMAQANGIVTATPQGPTLTLDAEARQRVPEDTAWANFSVEKESANQAEAQQAGKAALADVMAVIKKAPALIVSTENSFTSPVHNNTGKITGWRTNFSVRIESTDTAQVAKTMSELMSKARLSGSGSSLSDAAQKKVQDQLIDKAVKAFETKAKTTAGAMGFSRFEYGNVAVNQSGAMPMPRFSIQSMSAPASLKADAPPMSIEPGQSEVSVQISGTVKLIK